MNETKIISNLIGSKYYDSYLNKDGREVQAGYICSFLVPFNEYEKNRGSRGLKVQTANFNREQVPSELDKQFKKRLDNNDIIPINVYYVVENLNSVPKFTKIEEI